MLLHRLLAASSLQMGCGSHGTYKIYHGTGKYRGIRGSGTYHFSLTLIAARAGGKCSQTLPPVAYQVIITASGPVSLP